MLHTRAYKSRIAAAIKQLMFKYAVCELRICGYYRRQDLK